MNWDRIKKPRGTDAEGLTIEHDYFEPLSPLGTTRVYLYPRKRVSWDGSTVPFGSVTRAHEDVIVPKRKVKHDKSST